MRAKAFQLGMLAESLSRKDKDPKDQPQFSDKLRKGELETRANAWEPDAAAAAASFPRYCPGGVSPPDPVT